MLKLSDKGLEELETMHRTGFTNLPMSQWKIWNTLTDLEKVGTSSLVGLLTPGRDSIIGAHTDKHPKLVDTYFEAIQDCVQRGLILDITPEKKEEVSHGQVSSLPQTQG